MADFTLTPEEHKHLGHHLLGYSYPKKEDAQMSVDLLLRLGYKAELVEADHLDDGPEWAARCDELEPVS